MKNIELQNKLKNKSENLEVNIRDYWLTDKFGEILSETGANACVTSYLEIEKKDNILIIQAINEVESMNVGSILSDLKKHDNNLEIYIENNLSNNLERLDKPVEMEDVNGIEGIELKTFNGIEKIYLIKHKYSTDVLSDSLLIKSKISEEELERIIVAIIFKFEDLFGEDRSIALNEILEVLEKFNYITNMKIEDENLVDAINRYAINNSNFNYDRDTTILDIYISREMYCSRPNSAYRSIKNNEKEIEQMILGYSKNI